MLTTQALPPIPTSTTGPAARPVGRDLGWLAAVALLAYFPFLVRHADWLWIRPHYQFFPLVLLGAVVLAYVRLRTKACWSPGVAAVATAGLAASCLVLAEAELLASPWLACVSLLLFMFTLAFAAGGWDAGRRALPAIVLLGFVLPPPLDLDRLLIFKLQMLTTSWSSAVLDALSVFHLRTGNVIEVDGRQLMVEQACSGVNSLFSLLAATAFLVFLTRRSWLRGGLLMAAAIVWVLAANVARVIAVVQLETRWGISAATGWRHEALGLLCFAAAAGLLLSTDRFLAFLFDNSRARPDETAPARTGSAAQFVPRSYVLRPLVFAGIAAYLALAGLHWIAAEPTPRTAAAPPPPTGTEADWIPKKLGPWERTDFATQSREIGNYFGDHSLIWVFTHGRGRAQASLDYPFQGWHDLTWCYTGKGWQIDDQAVRDDLGVPGGFVEVRMTQQSHRHGYLLFCEFDREGRPLAARPVGTEASLFRHQSTLRRVRARVGLDNDVHTDPAGPVFQYQVLVEGFGPLAPEEEAAVRQLFIRSQAPIREAVASRR